MKTHNLLQMKNQYQAQTGISPGAIAKRAYLIWEAAGCPSGRDREHWLQAEAELAAASQHEITKSVAPAATPKQGPARSAAAPAPEPRFAKLNGRKPEPGPAGIPRHEPSYKAARP
jgi:hypothetical protein